VALAHRRLAVIDLTPDGRQPMMSGSGRYVISYNGEIYNFPDLRSQLAALGHAFQGSSDTAVLVEAFDEWGVAGTLPRLNGMFALAAWDRRATTLVLARDRFGEKPLYYATVGRRFAFASELRALCSATGPTMDIDRNALTLLLRHNYLPEPWSIYKGVAKVPAAAYLTLDLSTSRRPARLEKYWSLRDVVERGVSAPESIDDDDAIDVVGAILKKAVGQRMIADVPLGAFLSGGIDSSLVVAMMQEQSSTPVRTFSIGFNETGYDEAPFAKRVAAELGTDHTEVYVTAQEALDVIPILPSMFDEPFADSSQIPTFLVAKVARDQLTVALTGDGGDELFGGYLRYLALKRGWAAIRRIPYAARRRLSPLLRSELASRVERFVPARVGGRRASSLLRRAGDAFAAPGVPQLYFNLMSYWKTPSEIVIGGVEPSTSLSDPAAWPTIGSPVERAMYVDAMSYLPGDILTKVDRASMNVSLETRIPFLDHRLVEMAWRLPQEMRFRNWQGKWVLRQLLARYVSTNLFERPKMGFGVPIHEWLRGPLRPWAEDLLNERRLLDGGYLRPEPIRNLWARHLAGENWQYHLWGVLMFQAWHEHTCAITSTASH
jgi:asparagine synthase (glutamine-hydrolysing)